MGLLILVVILGALSGVFLSAVGTARGVDWSQTLSLGVNIVLALIGAAGVILIALAIGRRAGVTEQQR